MQLIDDLLPLQKAELTYTGNSYGEFGGSMTMEFKKENLSYSLHFSQCADMVLNMGWLASDEAIGPKAYLLYEKNSGWAHTFNHKRKELLEDISDQPWFDADVKLQVEPIEGLVHYVLMADSQLILEILASKYEVTNEKFEETAYGKWIHR